MSDFSSSLQNCVKMAPLAHFKTVEGSSVKRLRLNCLMLQGMGMSGSE